MRRLVFWGGRPAPRKSAIFAVQDGKIPDSPPRGPALRAPRRRGRNASRPKRVANLEVANRKRRSRAEEALL